MTLMVRRRPMDVVPFAPEAYPAPDVLPGTVSARARRGRGAGVAGRALSVTVLGVATAALALIWARMRREAWDGSARDDSIEPRRMPGTADDIHVARDARLTPQP